MDPDSPAFVDLRQRPFAGTGGEAPQELHVTEKLPGPHEFWVEDSRGRFAAEFLVHLHGPVSR